jgi:hypothetical protein
MSGPLSTALSIVLNVKDGAWNSGGHGREQADRNPEKPQSPETNATRPCPPGRWFRPVYRSRSCSRRSTAGELHHRPGRGIIGLTLIRMSDNPANLLWHD